MGTVYRSWRDLAWTTTDSLRPKLCNNPLSPLLCFWLICIFWRWLMKHPRLVTLISSIFVLTLLSDVRSFLVWQWPLSETALFLSPNLYSCSLIRVTAVLLNQLEQNCGCVSYQIFSPVIHIYVEHRLSPLQLLSSRGMTQFLFIIIMHSLPAWIDYTHATLCPQFNFLPGGM